MDREKVKSLCIIECRTKSTRLPGKVLLKFGKETIIEYMVRRIRRCRSIDKVVIATTLNPADDAIEDLCNKKGIEFFRGSEELVVSRVADTIKQYKGVERVTSLTGDCPFSYPPMIDYVNSCICSGNIQPLFKP